MTKPSTTITSYKGFDKDMKCRGFQFEVGRSYIHDGEVKPCNGGFHACEYPLSVFNYYSPSESQYAIVEQSGNIVAENDKTASSHLTVKGSISIDGLINAALDFTFSRVRDSKERANDKDNKLASNSGTRGAASNSGDYGAASNSGTRGVASNSGTRGAASNSGTRGAASNSGNQGVASNSGDYGAASNSGTRGVASNSGDYGVASNSGNQGVASNSGYQGVASTTGKQSVAAGFGYQNKAKASNGEWIVLAFRDDDFNIKYIKSAQSGITKGVKADTWYMLNENGKFVEAE